MTQRIVALLITLGVAIATVTSALALERLDETAALGQDAPPAKAPAGLAQTIVVETVKTAPAAKPQQKEQPVRVLKAAPAPKALAVRKRVAPALPQPAVVFAGGMVGGNMNNDAQVRQYMQQFRPIFRAEYHIVRVVCRLTPEQRTQIARAGERTLREASRKYVDMMRRPMTAAQRAALDPRKQIREGLASAVKTQLSADLAARFQEEIAKRDASRKQLGVRNLVARLDRDLVLSPDQRDKVAESLSTHWDDSWCQSLEMFMYDYQFFPPIPDQYVSPFLNDPQKKVWRSTQKVQTFWGGFGMMGGVMVDDPLEDDELRVARQEAAKADPEPAANRQGVMMREMMKVQMVAPVQAKVQVQMKAFTKQARPAVKVQMKRTIEAKKEVPK